MKRRRVARVATEVAEKIAVPLQHNGLDTHAC
ncbi:hypothetical protein MPNT_150004 [Candidatus Methylacidithermus pantelleriae]|uniref:Uncharacterized protein n=1 Tax=Candidatus Methylacidithermus pantelleriae TaxID=2744239 RepID=A0A8J2BIG7_9BACT|nr:hypothetical protein MPNT_150004 [Candidatus Methylacidithermus pantelleriae]